MRQSQYALIAGHPLRNIYRNMIQDRRDLPGVKEVKEAIAEALPEADEKLRDAIFADVQKLARTAQERGREHWFDLRGAADLKVLAVLEAQVAADKLVPDNVAPEGVVPVDDGEEIDAKALVDEMTSPMDRSVRAFTDSLSESAQGWS